MTDHISTSRVILLAVDWTQQPGKEMCMVYVRMHGSVWVRCT